MEDILSNPVIQSVKPARNDNERELQVVNKAIALAEKRIMDGTASSQIICQYLKMASPREKLERDLLEAKIEHERAATKSIKAADELKDMYEAALAAMKRYSGSAELDDADAEPED